MIEKHEAPELDQEPQKATEQEQAELSRYNLPESALVDKKPFAEAV